MIHRSITVAHSPDTDDVFMFWAIATGRLDTGSRRYELLAEDIEVLNRAAREGTYDVTAISFGAYPYLAETYAVLDSGGSIGDDYGPILAATETMSAADLAGCCIAHPGKLTTAWLAARLLLENIEGLEVPFKDVGEAIKTGRARAGILIHEGQLTCERDGLIPIMDLGRAWHAHCQLPLPLGANAIAKSLGSDLMREVAVDCRASIELALEHRDEALQWTQERCPGLDIEGAHHYLDMYVNEDTVCMSGAVREGIARLFKDAHSAGLITEPIHVEIIDGAPS